MDKIIAYIDGGARGNPGPAAIGFVLLNEQGKVLKEHGQTLGVKTNNEAEYSAAIFALEKIKSLWGKTKIKNLLVEVRSDSQLLVEQMNGRYKVSNKNLALLFLKLWNLKIDFNKVEFVFINRSENVEADRLVNESLDQEARKLF
jgi:ribonuclease HI